FLCFIYIYILLLLFFFFEVTGIKMTSVYFYTGVSGIIDFPEFTAVGLVDEGQFMYFDSNTKKAVPKTEWIRKNVGEDYWNREAQIDIKAHQIFKITIQNIKVHFNQSDRNVQFCLFHC
uniref:MHC class I-like antigen recognition-like domain-containing protein n=1 Tax=Cyprinus carpio TaxID=7962 RepID=A0A8C1M1T3_CYPCA